MSCNWLNIQQLILEELERMAVLQGSVEYNIDMFMTNDIYTDGETSECPFEDLVELFDGFYTEYMGKRIERESSFVVETLTKLSRSETEEFFCSKPSYLVEFVDGEVRKSIVLKLPIYNKLKCLVSLFSKDDSSSSSSDSD